MRTSVALARILDVSSNCKSLLESRAAAFWAGSTCCKTAEVVAAVWTDIFSPRDTTTEECRNAEQTEPCGGVYGRVGGETERDDAGRKAVFSLKAIRCDPTFCRPFPLGGYPVRRTEQHDVAAA